MKKRLLKSLVCTLVIACQVLSFSMGAFASEVVAEDTEVAEDENPGQMIISPMYIQVAEEVYD